MFSIHCDVLLVVFPQHGYRVKPTRNQRLSEWGQEGEGGGLEKGREEEESV